MTLLKPRVVIVLEEFGRTAVDTGRRVAFVYDTSLATCWVAMTTRCVDRTTLRVVDENPQERRGRDPLDDTSCDRRTVVEGASVAAHVQDDFGRHRRAAAPHELDQRVGPLLRDRRPTRPGRVRGRVSRLATHDLGVD